ncbi:MAG TPA: hypothetical protein VII20_05290 [Roseiarcus sp.]|jgi:hypothetical protein
MQLKQALTEISALRLQMARSTEFHGFGPATLAITGGLAAAAALVQGRWLPDPIGAIGPYLILWSATAAVSVTLIAAEAIRRSRRTHFGLADDMLAAAAEQFLPSAFAGALLTLTLLVCAPESLWMLPGLWQIIFSVGMAAACRNLPRLIAIVPAWYLATGLACLALARAEHALSPWAMGLPFLIGQEMAAVLLWVSYRGQHDAT